MAPVQVSMAPLAPLLLVLLASSALAPCRAVVVRVPCPSISAVSVSISTANVSSFFDGGGLTFDNADSPEECISLAQQNGCYGDINKFYVYSKEGGSLRSWVPGAAPALVCPSPSFAERPCCSSCAWKGQP